MLQAERYAARDPRARNNFSESTTYLLQLFRVFCEEVFTTETPSSQSSENF